MNASRVWDPKWLLVNLSLMRPKMRAVFHQGHGRRADQTGRYISATSAIHAHLSCETQPVIHVGQSLPKLIVRATSAFRPDSDHIATRRHVAKVPSRKSVDLSIASSAHSSSTKHLRLYEYKASAVLCHRLAHNMASIVIGSHFWRLFLD